MSSVQSIAILGTDALLAALPATPVQLAHACLALGYTGVFPVSWGDELVAAGCLRRLAEREERGTGCAGPLIQCSCPRVTGRLLNVGADLAPFIIPFVAPPVATARLLRTLYGATPLHVTYVGNCPFDGDPSVDARVSPAELLTLLDERGIVPSEQPEVFEGVIPPDRSRFYSLPGGVPTREMLWSEGGERALVVIDSEDYSTELAQHLLARERALLDLAPRLGCVCSGAAGDGAPRTARDAAAAVDPPRAWTPVLPSGIDVDIDFPLLTAPGAPPTAEAVAQGAPEQGATKRDAAGDGSSPSAELAAPREPAAAAQGEAPGAETPTLEAPIDISAIEEPTAVPDGPPSEQPSEEPSAVPEPAGVAAELGLETKLPRAEPPSPRPTVGCTSAERVPVGSEVTVTDAQLATAVAELPETTPTSPRRRFVSAGAVPVTRTGEGRVLPRAYVARRRLTPPGGIEALGGVATLGGGATAEAPRVDAPRAEAPRMEAARSEAPRADRRVDTTGDGPTPPAYTAPRLSPRAIIIPIPNEVPRPVPPPPHRDRTRLIVTIFALLVASLALVALAIRSLGGGTAAAGDGAPRRVALATHGAIEGGSK
jgi:hypothetical protein